MSFGLSNDGELRLLREYFNTYDVNIGLYLDATDTLTDSDGTGAITTEPSGSNYSPQNITTAETTVTLNANNDALLKIDQQTFSVGNSSQNIDAIYIVDPTSGSFLGRGEIDTSDRQTDYINLDQISSFRIGGGIATLD